MSKCRTEGVQALLVDIVEKNSWNLNREQLFGFIEVYSRNLGDKAVVGEELADLGRPVVELDVHAEAVAGE